MRVAVVVDALQHLLHDQPVLGIGGADEEVVGDVEVGFHLLEPRRVLVGQRLGLHPLRLGRVGDRLAVLVGAGQEEHVGIALAHMPGDHVGRDRLVGVAEVGRAVDVLIAVVM